MERPKVPPAPRAKPNLVIETEFQSQDDAANTVPFIPEHQRDEFANDYIEGLSPHPYQQPRNYMNQSIVEPLQQPQQLMRGRRAPQQFDLQVFQSFAIGLQTLNIFQKLWKRRMYIECFNTIRLTRNHSLSRNRSQIQLRGTHKHSSSVMQPARNRWALHDRSVNRIGSTIDHDNSIQRARLLNQIADKLSQRSSRQVIIVQQPPLPPPPIPTSDAQLHQRVVESKLDRLQKMMRDIKRVNQASNVQSTVYSIRRPEQDKKRRVVERESRREREARQYVEMNRSREEEQQQQIQMLSRDVYALKEEVRQIREESRRSSREQSPSAFMGPGMLFERRETSPGYRGAQYGLQHSRSQYATYAPITVTSPQDHDRRYQERRKGHTAITEKTPQGYPQPTSSPIQMGQVRPIIVQPSDPFKREVGYPYHQIKPTTSPAQNPCPMCGCGTCDDLAKK